MNNTPEFRAARQAYRKDQSPEVAEAYIKALEAKSFLLESDLRSVRSSDALLERLAGIGMMLEIGGHEIYRMQFEFQRAWRKLPDEVRESPAGQELIETFEILRKSISDNSDLRATRNPGLPFTGEQMVPKLQEFVGGGTFLQFEDSFRNAEFHCQKSALYPALTNLISNARSWSYKCPDDTVILTVRGGEIIVADNGPGVPEGYESAIFQPGFSKRHSQGIGLYLVERLAKQMIGSVRYITDDAEKVLPGANFALKVPMT